MRHQKFQLTEIIFLGMLVFGVPLFADISDSGLEKTRRRLMIEYPQPGEPDSISEGRSGTFSKKSGDQQMGVDSTAKADYQEPGSPD